MMAKVDSKQRSYSFQNIYELTPYHRCKLINSLPSISGRRDILIKFVKDINLYQTELYG